MLHLSNEPEKIVIVELDTGETLEAQFNPEALEEALEVDYSRTAPKGGSHEAAHYDHTSSLRHTLELTWRARNKDEFEELVWARRRIHAWAYPVADAQTNAGGEPPILMLSWPGVLSMNVRLISAKLTHQRFDAGAQTMHLVAALVLEEVRDTRMTYNSVISDQDGRFGTNSAGV